MKQAVCLLIKVPNFRPYWANNILPEPQKDHYYVVSISRRNDDTQWGLPGGKVDEGETLIQAIIRETKEKIGIMASESELQPVYTGIYEGEVNYEVTTYLYTGKIDIVDTTVEDGFVMGYSTVDELCNSTISPFSDYNQRLFQHLEDSIQINYLLIFNPNGNICTGKLTD